MPAGKSKSQPGIEKITGNTRTNGKTMRREELYQPGIEKIIGNTRTNGKTMSREELYTHCCRGCKSGHQMALACIIASITRAIAS